MSRRRLRRPNNGHNNFDISVGDDPCKLLWGSVLRQALQDVQAGGGVEHGRAATWFASRRTTPCSFEWVCDVFNLNPEIMRKYVGIEVEPAHVA